LDAANKQAGGESLFDSCLSERNGALGPAVAGLVEEHLRIWKATPSDPAFPEKAFPRAEKKAIERDLAALLDRVLAERKGLTVSGEAWEPAKVEELAASFRPVIKNIIGRVGLPIGSVYDERFLDSSRRFLQSAREFDPGIGIDAVFQALRNVWIMNTLQFYLGLEVRLTDAIFGYSMIYPFLDNFLDDADVSGGEKLALVLKLRSWLEGGGERPETPLESSLRSLIALIERQYPRDAYPAVYESMRAIYNAQVRSLFQQKSVDAPDSDVILEISLEKGGTSVLADGYLVAGMLDPGAGRFCFGLGTFLQFADDLQDIGEDLKRGDETLFTRAARMRSLEPLVHHLCRYTQAVVSGSLEASRPAERALRDLIPRSSALMYIESAGKHPSLFSRPCRRAFQKAFPVRFAYAGKLRKTLQSRVLTGHEKISDLDPVSIALMTISTRAFALD
jgi:hypothetical protein